MLTNTNSNSWAAVWTSFIFYSSELIWQHIYLVFLQKYKKMERVAGAKAGFLMLFLHISAQPCLWRVLIIQYVCTFSFPLPLLQCEISSVSTLRSNFKKLVLCVDERPKQREKNMSWNLFILVWTCVKMGGGAFMLFRYKATMIHKCVGCFSFLSSTFFNNTV